MGGTMPHTMLRFVLAACSLLLWCRPVRGAIILEIDNPVQSGSPDAILMLVGTVTNTGPESFPSGFSSSFPPGFSPDFAEVLVPLSFAGFRPGPGESYNGDILGFHLLPGSVGQSVTLTFSLAGLPAGSSEAIFSNSQQVTLTGVPEPGSAALLLGGSIVLLLQQLWAARHRR